MTDLQRKAVEQEIKTNPIYTVGKHVAVDTQYPMIGTDENGTPLTETIYENAPENHLLVKEYDKWNGAILEDLDYKEPTDEQEPKETVNS